MPCKVDNGRASNDSETVLAQSSDAAVKTGCVDGLLQDRRRHILHPQGVDPVAIVRTG